jgi:hypothetical protein
VIRKADVFKKNLVQSINNEKNIMAMANNPFVVRFYYRWAVGGGWGWGRVIGVTLVIEVVRSCCRRSGGGGGGK